MKVVDETTVEITYRGRTFAVDASQDLAAVVDELYLILLDVDPDTTRDLVELADALAVAAIALVDHR